MIAVLIAAACGAGVGGLATAGECRRRAVRRAKQFAEAARAAEARRGAEVAVLEERLAAAREHHAEQMQAAQERAKLAAGSREQLRDEMKALSADVLGPLGERMARELQQARRADAERADAELGVGAGGPAGGRADR